MLHNSFQQEELFSFGLLSLGITLSTNIGRARVKCNVYSQPLFIIKIEVNGTFVGASVPYHNLVMSISLSRYTPTCGGSLAARRTCGATPSCSRASGSCSPSRGSWEPSCGVSINQCKLKNSVNHFLNPVKRLRESRLWPRK